MNHRACLRISCIAALIAAMGCSASPPPPIPADGKPHAEAGALTVPTKDLPKGAKLGNAKVLIQ